MKHQRLIFAALIVLGLGVYALASFMFPAQAMAPPMCVNGSPVVLVQQAPVANTHEAGVKQSTEEYVKAFNAHDAKAAAALWTADGEYIGVDGTTIRGRTAIEQSLAEEFKANPKSSIEIQVMSVRPIGRQAMMVEGLVKLKNQGAAEPSESHYSALQVLEDGKWLAASVREWISDPEAGAATKLLEWLVGDWKGKGSGGNISITYSWNETKTFLFGKYSIVKDGKTASSGTETLAHDPRGGLRSWTFDSSGTFCTGVWQLEGNHWIDVANGTLPTGTQIESVNLFIRHGQDAFSWLTTERTADGVPLTMLPPLKFTRVK